MSSVNEPLATDPADCADCADCADHYLWAWLERDGNHIRSRMFANEIGVPEDEATGSAAMRMTDYLSHDLTITQGKGSQIFTTWNPGGWVEVAGPVVSRRRQSAGLTLRCARKSSISRSKSSAEVNDRYTDANLR